MNFFIICSKHAFQFILTFFFVISFINCYHMIASIKKFSDKEIEIATRIFFNYNFFSCVLDAKSCVKKVWLEREKIIQGRFR